MPADHCDDTRPYTIAYDNNAVEVTLTWTWDGVSVPPDCNGVANTLHIRNNSQDTYRAMLPNAKRGPGFVDLPAGTDQTVSGGQLRQLGLDTIQDIAAVELIRV